MIKVVLFDIGGVLVRLSGPQFRLYRLAKKIRQKGIRVSILSNVAMPPGLILKWLHVCKGFTPVFLSYEEKIRKPYPEIYDRVVNRLGVRPEEIIFIDNLAGNLAPAKKLGMHVIHATTTSTVTEELRKILKQENGLDI